VAMFLSVLISAGVWRQKIEEYLEDYKCYYETWRYN